MIMSQVVHGVGRSQIDRSAALGSDETQRRKRTSIKAEAARTQGFEDHCPQLYFAQAVLCEGSTLVTVKNEKSTTVLKRGED